MKSSMMTIIKKEFARFFKDKRMVFSTIIMPGLLIYVLYSFMGQGFIKQYTVDNNYKAKAYIYNMPDSLEKPIKSISIKKLSTSNINIKEAKNKVKDKKCDLVVVFPENFEENINEFLNNKSVKPANVKVFYNSSKTESQDVYSKVISLLDNYESSLANVFDVNSGNSKYDLASDEDTTAQLLASMLPMLMLIFIFSGCLAIAPESIAGEKERGTIATLLVTPMKRSQLALGKIISLSVLGLLSGISSFVGTILSLPSMMSIDSEHKVSAAVYSAGDYIMLLLVILSTVLVIVSIMSIISAFAKSVKEATTYITPLTILVMLISITAMFGDGAKKAAYWYLIPIYNSVQSMNGIFGFTAISSNLIITVVVNLVFSLILSFVLTKMFESEKVMFSK